ncbi:MAG TPA: transposase [Candidatus Paceibacterota bacterium]|nr:transposase [Candidatus Paceibacterota bacterium]
MGMRHGVALDEWHHCYNRGVDKRTVFQSPTDYERFLIQLFVGNGKRSIHVSNLKCSILEEIYDLGFDRGEPLVAIGAYALMPNHFHLLLKQKQEDGIARFMQKVTTGYTMYFNKKNERTGALFAGSFKSQHVPNDRYLKHIVSYIHLNPAKLFDPEWKTRKGNSNELENLLARYRYSSFRLFNNQSQEQERDPLLGEDIFDLYEEIPSMHEIIDAALMYDAEQNIKV